MDKAPTFVGIDVSKRRLDIHSRPSGESSTFGYDDESVAALIERLVAVAPALIVLEATGGMEVRLAAALAAAGLPVAVVNPPGASLRSRDGPAGQDRSAGRGSDCPFRGSGPATGASVAR